MELSTPKPMPLCSGNSCLAIRHRRHHMWRQHTTQPYLLHDDNASCHMSGGMANFQQIHGIIQVPHPPYSPDLAPCDFFLFSYLKHQVRGMQFDSVRQMIEHIDKLMGDIPTSTWTAVFKDWKRCMKKCVHFGGWYFEGMAHPP